MTNVDALKNLAAKLCGVNVSEIQGETIFEILRYIAINYCGIVDGNIQKTTNAEMLQLIAETANFSGGSIEPLKSIVEGSVTELTLPEGITKIRDMMFCDSISLTKVTLPESLETIGEAAFADSPYLAEINIGKNINHIGVRAVFGTAFFDNANENRVANFFVYLGKYLLKSNLETVTNQFATTLNIPKGTKIIANEALSDETKIAGGVVIPLSVTHIGAAAFFGSENMKQVYICGTPEEIGESTFYGCKSLQFIRVPWHEGEVAGAPWGAPDTTQIEYGCDMTSYENDNPNSV